MLFNSVLIFTIVLVASIIVLSNCNMFLVFHICVSIVTVKVSINFLVLDGKEIADIVSICYRGMYSLLMSLM